MENLWLKIKKNFEFACNVVLLKNAWYVWLKRREWEINEFWKKKMETKHACLKKWKRKRNKEDEGQICHTKKMVWWSKYSWSGKSNK